MKNYDTELSHEVRGYGPESLYVSILRIGYERTEIFGRQVARVVAEVDQRQYGQQHGSRNLDP